MYLKPLEFIGDSTLEVKAYIGYDQRMSKAPFSVTIPLRFRDADSEGIMFFGRANELAHDAYEELVRAMGYSYKDWFENPEWGFPIRRSECDFKRPIRAGETVKITISVTEIGTSSFTTRSRFESQGGQELCEVSIVHVCFSRMTRGKMDLPSSVRERLETYRG